MGRRTRQRAGLERNPRTIAAGVIVAAGLPSQRRHISGSHGFDGCCGRAAQAGGSSALHRFQAREVGVSEDRDNEKLLKALLDKGKVNGDDVIAIKGEMRRNKLPLEHVLLDLGLIGEQDLLEFTAQQLRVPFISLEGMSPDPDVVTIIPEPFARSNAVIALERRGAHLLVAAANPTDLGLSDTLTGLTRCRLDMHLASRGEILKKLGDYHDHYQAMAVERLLSNVRDKGTSLARQMGLSLAELGDSNEANTAIRTLNLLLLQALIKRASDIHVEPSSKTLFIKYRIDGVLQTAQRLQPHLAPSLINRIKVMSRMDIAERRLPQDGSFHINVEGRAIDFRVATTPTVQGEKVVLRILDKQSTLMGLENLGFSNEQYLRLRQVIRRPNGIILMVGPTGSGKTTTLYATLMVLNTGHKNITTIEDPVEYQIDGITQIQVHEEIGLSFSSILRSVLRQDPDVVLVGEIRDLDTTKNAIRASLTGHLVFATLHTNDAVSAVTRLVDMGAEPYLIAPSLRAVISQRLVRTLCHRCKEEGPPDPVLLALLPEKFRSLPRAWHARGCRHCFNTGYRGRLPITEILVTDEQIRRLIVNRAPATELHQAAVDAGMTTIFEDGIYKVSKGLTTLEEVLGTIEAGE